MLPFTDNPNDIEMVHLYFYLKAVALKSVSNIENYSKEIDEKEPEIKSGFSIQDELKETFLLERFQQPKISEQVIGVIEYQIQEISDEDMLLLEKDHNIKIDDNQTILEELTQEIEDSVPQIQLSIKIPGESEFPFKSDSNNASFCEEEQGQSKEKFFPSPNKNKSSCEFPEKQHSVKTQSDIESEEPGTETFRNIDEDILESYR